MSLLSELPSYICALAFGFVGSMPLAGPIAVMVVSRAASGRFKEALRIGLGAAVAEGIYAGAAFWSFANLSSGHPVVVPISHAVTALLLAGLGVRFAFWTPEKVAHRSGEGRWGTSRIAARAGPLLLGFAISIVNPTLLVTWAAIVAFLYSKGWIAPRAGAAAAFGAFAGLGVGSWFVVLELLLRKYKGLLPQKALCWSIRVLGWMLVVLGVWSGAKLWLWFREERHAPPRVVLSVCFDRGSECSRSSFRRS